MGGSFVSMWDERRYRKISTQLRTQKQGGCRKQFTHRTITNRGDDTVNQGRNPTDKEEKGSEQGETDRLQKSGRNAIAISKPGLLAKKSLTGVENTMTDATAAVSIICVLRMPYTFLMNAHLKTLSSSVMPGYKVPCPDSRSSYFLHFADMIAASLLFSLLKT